MAKEALRSQIKVVLAISVQSTMLLVFIKTFGKAAYGTGTLNEFV